MLLALFLGFAAAGHAGAQAAAATNAPGSMPPMPMLDNDERVQLKKAHDEVMATHPDLKAEEEKLREMHDSAGNEAAPPSQDKRNAMFSEWKTYRQEMRAEMLKVDPTLAPIFAKLDRARRHEAPASSTPAQ